MGRYLFLRRLSQGSLLLLFFGSAHFGWSIAGRPVLSGNFSASRLLGAVPLADPLATLQILATGHLPASTVVLGALLVLGIYAILGGRSFCSWVCPMNPVSDFAGWLRKRMGLRSGPTLTRRAKWWVLALTLVLSAILGVAAFELVSPIAMLHRGILFGGMGAALAAGAVFGAELLHHDGLWCSRLCPLGAFYSLLGHRAALRVAFHAPSCTHCGECKLVCPEPQVLDLERAAQVGRITSGDCTNCGRCEESCPEGSLFLSWRSAATAGPSFELPDPSDCPSG